MRFERTAGILLHPTSLPGRFGIGDLGGEAYNFINFLAAAGQTLWQVFPLGPTGYGDSPYQCFSAFAGNPLLISPDKLKEYGFLTDADLSKAPNFNHNKVDYGPVINYKKELLKKAYGNFKQDNKGFTIEFEGYCSLNADWLDDFALFMASKEYHGGGVFTIWEKDLIHRTKEALAKWKKTLADDILYHKFVQWQFYKQWTSVREYANSKGIKIIGDMPIFIAYDSADLWAN